MKLVYQINLAFGISLAIIISIAAMVIHFVLLDYFIEAQKEELKAAGDSITSTFNQESQGDISHSPAISEDIEIILSDKNGEILSSSVPIDDIQLSEDVIKDILEGKDEEFISDVTTTPQGTITLLTPISKVKEIEQALLGRLLLVFVIGGVFTFICSLFITKKLITPLMKLREELEKVKERKFSDVKLIEVGGEIGSVAHSVYDMAGELDRYHHVQKQFFQNSSHELKTPLMSIAGYAEGIKDGIFEGESAQKGLDVIINESHRLSKLVTEMTLLAKLDSEEGIFEHTAFSLRDLVVEAVERVNPIAMKKNLTLHTEYDESKPFIVRADRNKLLQALINVMSNATRYANQKILVEITECKGHTQLVISDDGRGISQDLLPYLFHRFVKGKDGESGLGLAISRAIVERCGGSITADNRVEGGAMFTIGLPSVPTKD